MSFHGHAATLTGANDDLGFDPTLLDGEGLARHLELRVQQTLDEVLSSNVWRILSNPRTEMPLVLEILKEVYLEIFMYQPDSIEAAIASIGQMPRSMPPALVEEMLHHQVEEFDHGEMALRDFLRPWRFRALRPVKGTIAKRLCYRCDVEKYHP